MQAAHIKRLIGSLRTLTRKAPQGARCEEILELKSLIKKRQSNDTKGDGADLPVLTDEDPDAGLKTTIEAAIETWRVGGSLL